MSPVSYRMSNAFYWIKGLGSFRSIKFGGYGCLEVLISYLVFAAVQN